MVNRTIVAAFCMTGAALCLITLVNENRLNALEKESIQHEHLCTEVQLELGQHVELGFLKSDEAEAITSRCWEKFV